METILILQNKKGYVRSIDVANELGFTKASVSVAMKSLRNNETILTDINMVKYGITRYEGEVECYIKNEEVKERVTYQTPKMALGLCEICNEPIYNKEDIVSTRCADGKVFGEVWYKVVVELPKKYNEVSFTGKESYKLKVKFLDKEKIFFNNYTTYKVKSIFNIKNHLLPIEIALNKYIETRENDYIYNLDNVDDAAIKIANDKFSYKLGDEDVVLSKKVLKKEEKESKIIIEVFFKVKENITAYKEISDTEVNEDGG